jgi:hypothetical protein
MSGERGAKLDQTGLENVLYQLYSSQSHTKRYCRTEFESTEMIQNNYGQTQIISNTIRNVKKKKNYVHVYSTKTITC